MEGEQMTTQLIMETNYLSVLRQNLKRDFSSPLLGIHTHPIAIRFAVLM